LKGIKLFRDSASTFMAFLLKKRRKIEKEEIQEKLVNGFFRMRI